MSEEEGDEGVEGIEFGGEVGGSKGRAANRLADNAEAGGVFGCGGECGEGSSTVLYVPSPDVSNGSLYYIYIYLHILFTYIHCTYCILGHMS